jgi:hypothetical protein
MTAGARDLLFAIARAIALAAAEARLGLFEILFGELGLHRAKTGFVGAF